jgi:hypothetical protein
MKSFITTTSLLFTTLCIISSCDKEKITVHQEKSFNTQFTSGLNQHVLIKDDHSRIVVNVKNISDQRCKEHQVCSDGGNATVRIELSNMNTSKSEFLLYLGNLNGEFRQKDSVLVHLDNQSFIVYLHDVSPLGGNLANESQAVELSVSNKN